MSSINYDLEDILAEFNEASRKAAAPQPVDVPEPEKRGGKHLAEGEAQSGAAEAAGEKLPVRPEAERSARPAPGKPRPARTPREKPPVPEASGTLKRIGLGLLSLVFACAALLCLGWSLQNIHPNSGTSAAERRSSTDIAAALDAGSSVGEQTQEADPNAAPAPEGEESPAPTPSPEPTPIHYVIEPGALPAVPRADCYGTLPISEASAMLDVIAKAREYGLLEKDETMAFNPEANFYYDSEIQYYLDETILSICWKEVIEGNTCSFSEVKVADASQFRRKLAGDSFGSSIQYYATELAAASNAVVAMNADYYLFRDFGIVVYDSTLYRFNTSTYTGMYKKYNCVDNLFITGEGDFLFFPIATDISQAELEQYLRDNDVRFSIAFGPVLVSNGQVQECSWYPVGEIDRGYSRAGIGQKDHLHYFYMSLNHSAQREARWTVNTFGERMYERGLQQAYCLDGGQTSEIVWRGAPFNYIDFGGEREVSDIMYFATAIPESGGTP
jgi:exopolysaccharide biosynthesis protein